MEQKDTYTLLELFENLPISIAELARRSSVNEVTLARIRDGKVARRDTANRLLRELSKVYEHAFTLHNVTGLNVQGSKSVGQQAEREASAA
jgi:predicted transcriptional regulator